MRGSLESARNIGDCLFRELKDADCIITGLQKQQLLFASPSVEILLGSVSFFSNILETQNPFWRDLEALHDDKPCPVFLDDRQRRY